jgi:hypothetical protein
VANLLIENVKGCIDKESKQLQTCIRGDSNNQKTNSRDIYSTKQLQDKIERYQSESSTDAEEDEISFRSAFDELDRFPR